MLQTAVSRFRIRLSRKLLTSYARFIPSKNPYPDPNETHNTLLYVKHCPDASFSVKNGKVDSAH